MFKKEIFILTNEGTIFRVTEFKLSKGVTLAKKLNGKWYTLVTGDRVLETAESVELKQHEE